MPDPRGDCGGAWRPGAGDLIMGRFAELWSALAPDERSHAVTLVRRLSLIADDLA